MHCAKKERETGVGGGQNKGRIHCTKKQTSKTKQNKTKRNETSNASLVSFVL